WCTSGSLNSRPKVASERSISEPLAPPFTSFNFIASGPRSLLRRAGGLAPRLRGGLDRRADDDAAARGARHGTADEQQVPLEVHLDDLEVFHGAVDAAHAAGHALAREHASRRLALADRAGRAVHDGSAVARHAARETVALH